MTERHKPAKHCPTACEQRWALRLEVGNMQAGHSLLKRVLTRAVVRSALSPVLLVLAGVLALSGSAAVSVGTVSVQQGPKLTGSGDTRAGRFGESVALSADGNTALIGDPADSGGVGAVWVFTRSAGAWTKQGARLTGSREDGPGGFGASVALSADGNT